MRKEKRQGKRYLPASNLKMEVLDPLLRHWCCPDASSHVLPYPCVNVLTDPVKRESQDAGHQRGLELKSSRRDQEDPSRREKESGVMGLVPEEPTPSKPTNPSEGRSGGSRRASAGAGAGAGANAAPYGLTTKVPLSIKL